MRDMVNIYRVVTVGLTMATAVFAVFVVTLLSMLLVYSLRRVFIFIAQTVLFLGDFVVALVAAVVSGGTITLTVLAATAASTMTFPPSSLEARIGVSVIVSSCAIIVAACAVSSFTSIQIDIEILTTLVGASAMAVSFAAAWAIGVMSLIEKETQHVGLKMTSVLDAVRHNNYRILRLLVTIHSGIKQKELDTALLQAVKSGFTECTKVLLDAKANANVHDSHGNTPIGLACCAGQYNMLKMLIERGADVNVRDSSRRTPLHQAARWGYEDFVRLLLDNGADPDSQDGLWNTPLMLAAKNAQPAEGVMRMLIDAGCDVNIAANEHRRAIHYVASRGLDLSMLLAAHARTSVQDSEGNTPLHYAAMKGHYHTVKTLLAENCDPNIPNYQRRTSFHMAAMCGSVDCLQVLLQSNGNPNLIDTLCNFPVWYASRNGHFKAVTFFLQNGCPLGTDSLKYTNTHPTNPLEVAMEKQHFAVARILLLAGAPSLPLKEWLRESPADMCFVQSDLDHIVCLKEHLVNPSGLSHACRICIRNCLSINLVKYVPLLPLPEQLKAFILMKDLDHMQFLDSPSKMFDVAISEYS